jgi:hypothetical protein
MASGGNAELPEAVVFHLMRRYTGHGNQALAFYAPYMQARGARREGDGYVDDNMVHTGNFGTTGSAAPKDPSRPGVWLFVNEGLGATLVDIWESVPKAR